MWRVRHPELTKLRNLSRELLWVGAGQAGALLGGLVGLRVLTNALGAAEFGRLALALTISSLLGLTVFAGPGGATLRFFSAARQDGELSALIHGARRSLSIRTGLVAVVALVAGLPILIYAGADWLNLAMAAVMQAVFTSFSAILDGTQNAARQREIVAFHSTLANWLRWIMAWMLFGVFGESGAVALWGYALATVVVCCSQFLFFRRHLSADIRELRAVDPELGRNWTRKINAYALPYSIWGLPSWLHTSSERWALQRFADTRAVGLYAVVAQLGFGVVTLVSTVVLQLVAPILFHRAGDGLSAARLHHVQRTTNRIAGAFLGLTAVGAFLAAVLHETVFAWLVAPDFRSVSYLWPLSVLSGGAYACGQLLAVSVISGVSSTPLLAPKVGSAAIGLALTIAGAARWGLIGVIWASTISSICYLVWTSITARIEYRRAAIATSSRGHRREELVT